MHVGCGRLPAMFVFCSQTTFCGYQGGPSARWATSLHSLCHVHGQRFVGTRAPFCQAHGPVWVISIAALLLHAISSAAAVESSAACTFHHYGVYDARVRGMACELMTHTFGMLCSLHDMRTETHTGTAECIATLLQDASVVGGRLVAT